MTRERLPQRRRSETVTFVHINTRYEGTAGFYDDGRVAEVFLHGPKAGSDLEAVARDAAVTTSLALQHGVPLDTIRAALTREPDGTPAGAMGVLLEKIANLDTQTEKETAA